MSMRALHEAVVAVVKWLLTLLAAIVLLIEEWGWRPLTRAAAWIARWPPLARFEAVLQRAPPRLALGLFLVPAVLLFPIKLLALWLLQRHHPWLGLALIVGAKVVGTALVGRLFVVCESQLRTFPWFVKALDWWRATKARTMAALTDSGAWRAARQARRWMRVRSRRWWRGYDRR